MLGIMYINVWMRDRFPNAPYPPPVSQVAVSLLQTIVLLLFNYIYI